MFRKHYRMCAATCPQAEKILTAGEVKRLFDKSVLDDVTRHGHAKRKVAGVEWYVWRHDLLQDAVAA